MRGLIAAIVTAPALAAPAWAGPAATEPMVGPFADVTQVCAPCTTTARLRAPGSPLREVRVIFAGDPAAAPTPSNQLRHWLAIRTAAGWFVRELGFSGVICGGRSQSHVSLSASGLVARDVVGDADLEVELDVDAGVLGHDHQIDDRHRVICGVGASGMLRCADFFVRRRADRVTDSWDYTLAIARDGTVRMTHDQYGHADLPEQTLTFP